MVGEVLGESGPDPLRGIVLLVSTKKKSHLASTREQWKFEQELPPTRQHPLQFGVSPVGFFATNEKNLYSTNFNPKKKERKRKKK